MYNMLSFHLPEPYAMNPLLQEVPLPLFQHIQPEQIEPAIDQLLSENRHKLNKLLAQSHYTWDNLIQPLLDVNKRLNDAWSPVQHMYATVSTPAIRQAYQACLPKLTDYYTELAHNVELYNAIQTLADSPGYQQLNQAQKKVIENQLRDFKLAGVTLSADKKQAVQTIQQQLAQLGSRFEENLLDATDNWELLITEQEDLAGLPPTALNMAKEAAQRKQQAGWLLTLDYPSYDAVIRYADNRALREQLYRAYVTRASELGSPTHQWDNSPVMEEILALRYKLAQLLGFPQYAHYSLATKMAQSPQEVYDFILDLAKRTKPLAQKEWQALRQFAKEYYQVDDVQAWDLPYYSEKFKQHLFNLSQEQLRAYFPEEHVLQGLFTIVERLFNVRIQEIKEGIEVWHPSVRFFTLYSVKGEKQGHVYLDLHARPQKRGGAWMDECRIRHISSEGTLTLPVAYLTCNFSAPTANQPALLTHEEVCTLFHEFGHCLHHLLTQIDYAPISGINGVPWDAVEFPSQFLEHWCWQSESLQLLSRHYQTGEPLPDEMIRQLQATKQFQAGLQTLRQLEFALFDLRLHNEYSPTQPLDIQRILNEVRNAIAVIPVPAFNRFQHSFSHIFAGGYAAGYYSYKWAEVMASDAFSQFLETGIFNASTGEAFKRCILEKGGSDDPLNLFIAFRGRPPRIEALLNELGLAKTSEPIH